MEPSDDLERTVAEIIAQKKKISASSIHLDSTFQDLGIDSLDGIDLMFAIEERYAIAIPNEVVQRMRTVREIVDALREELDKRPRPAV